MPLPLSAEMGDSHNLARGSVCLLHAELHLQSRARCSHVPRARQPTYDLRAARDSSGRVRTEMRCAMGPMVRDCRTRTTSDIQKSKKKISTHERCVDGAKKTHSTLAPQHATRHRWRWTKERRTVDMRKAVQAKIDWHKCGRRLVQYRQAKPAERRSSVRRGMAATFTTAHPRCRPGIRRYRAGDRKAC